MPKDVVEEGAALLRATWTEVEEMAAASPLPDAVQDETVRKAIHRIINSNTKSYRYAAPTQILGKLVDPSLDCCCIQASRGTDGSWDARTLCHQVIVPFDKELENVLGGSLEPYVNNPLRKPEISETYAGQQKNKGGWEDLCILVNAVQRCGNASFTEAVFRQILIEIHRRLSVTRVTYPVPKRISLRKCVELIECFIEGVSGGDRLLAVSSALFLAIGKSFRLWEDVRRGSINAADAVSGQIADLECVTASRGIVLAVEVKDRDITINQISDKLKNLRASDVTEILFIAQQGVTRGQYDAVNSLVDKEYGSGHNIYIFDFPAFSSSSLALMGEDGRHRFLQNVGKELDRYNSDIRHRRAWAALLAQY